MTESHKHPVIFKIADLIKDEVEWQRFKEYVERDAKLYGLNAIFIERMSAVEYIEISNEEVESKIVEIHKLSKQNGITDHYYGKRASLKTALYTFMYTKSIDPKIIEEIIVKPHEEEKGNE
ncbi:hypothetical protein W70_42 [Escherichia phage W70]|nr:hypothetical protein W70_42 [Escherichia phage W70]